MTRAELHIQIEGYAASSLGIREAAWHQTALLHALIDLGIITEWKCQREDCIYPGQAFQRRRRADPFLLCIDHISPRRDGENHRPENLRILHMGCNAGWRKGLPGTFFTNETIAQMSESMKKAHADGKFAKIYTPERNAKISQALKGRKLR